MQDSPFFTKKLGCSGNLSVRNASKLHLNDTQCSIVIGSLYYYFIFGIIGCTLHSYIIFCYHFKRTEARMPIQTLIMCLSVYDFLCCLFLVASWYISEFTLINKAFSCANYTTFTSIDKHTIYAVVLLLVANRFYSICKPPQQYLYIFSNRRIIIYISAIFICGFSTSFVDQVYNCYFGGNSFGTTPAFISKLSTRYSSHILSACSIKNIQ